MRERESLEELLQQLSAGSTAAAERVFVKYAPYLQIVVRRLLPSKVRSKFDSIDIVQSVWVDLLEYFRLGDSCFENANQLRAFLVKATRNRFFDRVRSVRPKVEKEVSIPPSEMPNTSPGDSPHLGIESSEMWESLLDTVPERQHRLLCMKRDGHSVDEIARETGLHPSSVRRILYDLAKQVLGKQEPETTSHEQGSP